MIQKVVPAPATTPVLLPCPVCQRQVSSAAASCPGCDHPLAQPLAPQGKPGIAAVLSLIIPGAGQMYRGAVGRGLVWLISVDHRLRVVYRPRDHSASCVYCDGGFWRDNTDSTGTSGTRRSHHVPGVLAHSSICCLC